jgi:uncharacterized membrane protein YbhN (UPF0104 family)
MSKIKLFLRNNKKPIIKILKVMAMLIVVFFIVRYLYNNFGRIRELKIQLNIPVFIISILLFWVYKFADALLWHYITVKNHCSIPLEKAVIAWMYSMLGKFVPGTVFYVGGRLYFYSREGASKKLVSFCFIFENVCTLLAATSLFIISLFFINADFINQYKYLAVLFLVLLFVLINPFFIKTGMNLLLKIFKKNPIEISISYKDIFFIIMLYIVNWLILGLGFYMLVNSIVVVEIRDFFFIAGSYALACIIGILAVFAPSGIGVRESIMVLTLRAIISEPIAIVVSVIARIWATIGELVLVLLTYIYAKIRKIKM